jgi:hypothetical protein
MTSKKNVFYKGNVSDQTTILPIEGINIKLYGDHSGIIGPGTATLLAETYTDKNGDFTIDTKIKLEGYDNFSIGAHDDYTSSDTNRAGYNYLIDSYNLIFVENLDDFPAELNFILRPKGVIRFSTNDQMDKIIIKSPFDSDTLINFREVQLYFPPNKTYSFEFSNVVNNQIVKTIYKDIYIPNNNSSNSLFSFKIVFDD